MVQTVTTPQAIKKISSLGPDILTQHIALGGRPRTPLSWRFGYFFKLWAAKLAFSILVLLIKRKRRRIQEIKPTLVKSYPCRPHLPARIFLPESASTASKQQATYPLFIDIHGGGYAVGDASLDDPFCSLWRDRTGMIVAALNYSKTPGFQYPVQLHEVAAVARAIIDDPSLPIDRNRIVIGGFSAGGNLALTASQRPELKGLVQAAIVWYPILDWSVDTLGKWETRLSNALESEPLSLLSRTIDWGYVPIGKDRTDPLLSPWYAEKDDLPPKICFVAPYNDFLCRESRSMACKLSGKTPEEVDWESGFEEGNYKFVLVKDEGHGFVDDWVNSGEGTGREERIKEMYASIDGWLREKGLLGEIRIEAPRPKL